MMTAFERVESTKPDQQRARARTAQQLARQERCFYLSVLHGKTTREIAIEVGITRETVIGDLRAECERRRDENAERREHDTARAIAFYERVMGRAMKRADLADAILEQILNGSDCDEEGKGRKSISDRSLDVAIKARERIDKLLGLDAPAKLGSEPIEIIVTGGISEYQQYPLGVA